MRVAYLGNFGVPYSTESHVAASLESLGHTVERIQEGETRALDVPARTKGADVFLWTQTYGLAVTGGDIDDRAEMLVRIDAPTVAFHLDRWWGLGRETQVAEEPFFRCDYVFTADGGHDEEWEKLGINHHWLPPAVYHAEAYDGNSRAEYSCDVVFVGSWRSYGHEEWWPTRRRMLEKAKRRYGRHFKTFPLRQAVRGKNLTDLYASCKVAIGDSCLAGNPSRYWSDRVPETLGRGALLVHPNVEGLRETHPYLPVYEPGDFERMVDLVDYYLHEPQAREEARCLNSEDARANHTYRNRMQVVLDTVLGGR